MVRPPALDTDPSRSPDVAARFLAFALAVVVFHHAPALAHPRAEEWVDLVTPFAVLGTAAWALAALRPSRPVVVLAVGAGILYADGHGIHLAANAIRSTGTSGAVEAEAHFWDETWGHIEWHAGLFLALAALALADRRASVLRRWPLAAAAALLGFTFFTNTVEGGDWWLALVAGGAFAPWAAAVRTPLRVAAAAALALCAALLGAWALWQGGMPQFSELGWL